MTLPTLEEHVRTNWLHQSTINGDHDLRMLAIRNVLAVQTVHSLLALLASTSSFDAEGVLNDFLRESGAPWRIQFDAPGDPV